MARKPTPKDLEQFEQQLRHLMAVLNGDIRNLESEALSGAAAKTSTAGEGEDYMQEFSLELLQHDEETVREVTDALERLERGDFGRCEACKKWIRKERLKAVPHARNCIDCQRARERGELPEPE